MGVARVRGKIYFRPGEAQVTIVDPTDAEPKTRRSRGAQLNRVLRDEETRRVATEIIDHIRDDERGRETLAAALRASTAGEDAQTMIREVADLAQQSTDGFARRAIAKVARSLADATISTEVRRVTERLDDPIVRAAMATAATRPEVAALLDKLDKGVGGAVSDAVAIFADAPEQRDALTRAADLAQGGAETLEALGASIAASEHGRRGREAVEAAMRIAGPDLAHLDLLTTMGGTAVEHARGREALAGAAAALTDAEACAAMARVLGDARVVALLRRLGSLPEDEYACAVTDVAAAADIVFEAPRPRRRSERLRRVLRVARALWHQERLP